MELRDRDEESIIDIGEGVRAEEENEEGREEGNRNGRRKWD